MDVSGRLKYARERVKLTLSEVKAQTGIGESSLSEFENGKREPSLGQLHALASAYKRTLSFFLEETAVSPEVILWRKRPQDGVEKIEAQFWQLCERYHNLEVWTGDVRNACLPESKVEAKDFGYREATALARNVRHVLQLGDHPGPSLLPVLEESCGVKVFHLDFEPSGTAASVKSDRFGASILLNSKNKRWRRNFDLAHELFHLLTWDVFTPAAEVADDDDRIEKLATCFARNLLMPAESMRTAIDSRLSEGKLKYESFFDIAREFDVSVEAMVRHMSFMWSLSKEQTEQMLTAAESWRPFLEDRVDSPPPPYPERYRTLAVQALHRGEISIGRFAEYLGISRQKAMMYLQQETLNHEEIQMPPASATKRRQPRFRSVCVVFPSVQFR
jgi:Zn-dependent peptidase ImmA (M78 family)/DNA-binding XRE family transcriptional regulator